MGLVHLANCGHEDLPVHANTSVGNCLELLLDKTHLSVEYFLSSTFLMTRINLLEPLKSQ